MKFENMIVQNFYQICDSFKHKISDQQTLSAGQHPVLDFCWSSIFFFS